MTLRSPRPRSGAVPPGLTLAALLLWGCAHGQPAALPAEAPASAAENLGAAPLADGAAGSGSFCLFEVPGGGAARKFVNLGIVQYIELTAEEARIYYGGGNLGSGHEARIALTGRDAGEALLARLREAARACR